MASEFGQSQFAAEAGARANAGAAVKAQMRAALIRLEVHLHANANVTIAGIRVRRLIDPELVLLIDLLVSSMVGVDIPIAEAETKRVEWLRAELGKVASPATAAELFDELRQRTLLALSKN